MISYEKFLPHISLLGVCVAITFDVGYFWGVDINFFTLFSLSEHTLFAVQALPYVIVILGFTFFIIFITLAYLDGFNRRRQRRVDAGVSESSRRSLLRFYLMRGAVVAWFLGSMAWNYSTGSYRLLIWTAVILAFMVLLEFCSRDYLRSILIGAGTTISLVSAFLFGHFLGASYVSDANPIEEIIMKDGTERHIRIIHNGERGILYFDTGAKAVRFEQWDDLRSLVRRKD
jgi:hypothetical protein